MDSKETLCFVAKLLLIWTLLAFILAFIAPVLSVVLFLFLFVLGIPALMIAMWGRSKQLRQQQSVPRSPNRTGIPSAVKQRVWRRDGGRCVECGSNENLEYDHIIPVSKAAATPKEMCSFCV
jgi:hypothetical protein